MNIRKLLRPFLKLTAEEKSPTDIQLDNDIEYVSDIIHKISPVLSKIIRNKVKRYFLYRWKFLLGRLIIASSFLYLGYFAFVKILHVQISQSPITREVITSYPSDSSMNLRNYLLQIAYGESRYIKRANRDSSQFLGLYQVGSHERKITGFGDIPRNVFLNHVEIQDLCMIELLKINKKDMQSHIDKYSGKILDGILITESGVLALCQLGTGSAKKWLDGAYRGDIIPEFDENGNSPRKLLKMGGYILNLDKVKYSIQDAVSGPVTIK